MKPAWRAASKKARIVRKKISKTLIHAIMYGHLSEHVPILNWSASLPHTERIVSTFQPTGYTVNPTNNKIAKK